MKLTQQEQVFYEPWACRFVMIQRACSCHPSDIIVTWGNGFTHAASYSFRNNRQRNKFMRKRYLAL